jgi:hypothetical protein
MSADSSWHRHLRGSTEPHVARDRFYDGDACSHGLVLRQLIRLGFLQAAAPGAQAHLPLTATLSGRTAIELADRAQVSLAGELRRRRFK